MVSGMKVPELTPARPSRIRNTVRFPVSGSRRDVMKNATMPTSSTRRGPKTAPRYGEATPIIIWPMPKLVVIQAPSSNPTCRPPRRSARPKLVVRDPRVPMIEPSSTPRRPK
jgi:hypothetical protein